MVRPLPSAVLASVLAALAMPSAELRAQGAYPSQRVLIVVGFPAGGPSDIAARALADGLAPRLGKPAIIENRPGGGGVAAASAVARSEPDGHTLMMAGEGPISVLPALANPPQDVMTGLAVAGIFAEGGCNVVATHPSLPATDLKGLIALAKSAKEPLNFASGGLGTPSDTVAAEFAQAAGIQLKRVIYRGAGLALSDLIAGHVPLMFPQAGQAAENINAGKLRGLAVSTKERCKVLPGVATMTEQGLPLEAGRLWFGLLAPAATPAGVLDRLFKEIQAIAATPELAARLDSITALPVKQASRAEADAFVRKDVADWQHKAKTVPGLR